MVFTPVFLHLPTPFFAMRLFCALADFRMASGEEQGAGIADFCPDQAEITCCVEQTRIPPLPVRQQFFDLMTQVHRCNVYEQRDRNNDQGPFMDHQIILRVT